MNEQALCTAALQARKKAYVPYSHFAVGAALLTADGKIYDGCNIENAAYSVTVCAERVALFKAVSDGVRNFIALAVAGGAQNIPATATTPCGVCRQALAEFCTADMPIYLVNENADPVKTTLGALLPSAFTL